MDLDGKAAWVTGGASGIGEAIVAHMQRAGARVASIDLRAAKADLSIEADVADEAQMSGAVRQTVDVLGGLDVAVLNAGIGGFSPVRLMTTEEWDRVHRVNLRAVFIGMRECANAMQNGGAIVATASTSGILAERGMVNYSTAKAGVIQLVRVAARELGPDGIRVNAVAPGATQTPLFAGTDALPGYRDHVAKHTPLGRVGTPDDIAQAVLALLTLDWVTGQVLVAD